MIQRSSFGLGTIEAGKSRRRSRVIVINGIEVKLKYCKIYNIYPSPRTFQCAIFNNCFQQFDHHCVGLRNYLLDVMFLFTGLLLFTFIVFISSCKNTASRIVRRWKWGDWIVKRLPRDTGIDIIQFSSHVRSCWPILSSCLSSCYKLCIL
ncbi:unnamed protein product [Coffea canephora]|uniref:S-acyltransferase n=1 Tax=Coffea canephora TaxID=49390 RepID=A0A068UQU9_COFCA|nr:unnamed protein product [Coffea canephora]